MPIDLSKLVLPEIPPDEPLPLEDRVKALEAAMRRKLHKRLDAIEANRAGANTTKMSGDKLREKAKQLEGKIREELVKKVTKIEKRRHKSLLKKVRRLEETIEAGGSGSESGAHPAFTSEAVASAGADDGSVAAIQAGEDQAGEDPSVLDANNNEAIFHLGSSDDASDAAEEDSSECGPGSAGVDGGVDRVGGAGGLAPCAIAGSHGLNMDGSALYVGGAADVSATQPVYHKVKTLDHGALSMDLVTDLDDPPPKAQAGATSNSVPLDQIVEGSNSPKSQVVSEAVASHV
jgi:hypothetical protein